MPLSKVASGGELARAMLGAPPGARRSFEPAPGRRPTTRLKDL